jgi:BirA family biotin operon repressor/biotin-[acetyl-CoA-carboxylase] ligase
VAGSPYRDLARPPLRAEPLRRALVRPGELWTDVRITPVTESTNADVVAAAGAGTPQGLVVVAESQTAGRGRLDRTWVAPARAGLTFSVLLRPDVPARTLGWLPLLGGVALVEAVVRLAEVDAVLKWPNDLLVRVDDQYAKCAGLLAEAVGPGPAVALGIGLNVSQRADELPPRPGSAGPATSLALAGAACQDRDPLLRAVLRSLADWYVRWTAVRGDPEASGLARAYERHCDTLGRDVEVELPGGDRRGRAVGVDGDGRLLLATADGP